MSSLTSRWFKTLTGHRFHGSGMELRKFSDLSIYACGKKIYSSDKFSTCPLKKSFFHRTFPLDNHPYSFTCPAPFLSPGKKMWYLLFDIWYSGQPSKFVNNPVHLVEYQINFTHLIWFQIKCEVNLIFSNCTELLTKSVLNFHRGSAYIKQSLYKGHFTI